MSKETTTPEHASIAAALATAQAEMGKALKDSKNPHFKSSYADLGSVMGACMAALNSNGIAVVQPIREGEMSSRYVVTQFLHTSGEVLECPVPLILSKNDMQGLGSAITYARRYGLMSLAGVAPEDDDGNGAVNGGPVKQHPSWEETILQELPDGATPHEKAKAVADALIAQWKRKKSAGELANEWDRRADIIQRVEKTSNDLYLQIVEAYESRMAAVSPVTEGIAAE